MKHQSKLMFFNGKDMSQGDPKPDASSLSLRIRMLAEMGSDDFPWLLVLAAETFSVASQGILNVHEKDSSGQRVVDRAAKDLTTRMDGLVREFLPKLVNDQSQAEELAEADEEGCPGQTDFAEDLRILNRFVVGFCNKYGRAKRGWNDDLRVLNLLARGFSAKHASSVQPDHLSD